MTGKEYIDEVKLRLRSVEVMDMLDDAEVLTYINKARRQIQLQTMSLYPEKYGDLRTFTLSENEDTTLSISSTFSNAIAKVYTATLDVDIIDIKELILQWTDLTSGVTYRSSARNVTKQEMYTSMMNAWSGPTNKTPLYCIERVYTGAGQDVSQYTLYITGLDTSATTNLWDIAGPAGVKIELWFLSAFQYIELTDDDIMIPLEFEELVIQNALLYCLENTNDLASLSYVRSDIQVIEAMLMPNYETDKQITDMLIPSKEGV